MWKKKKQLETTIDSGKTVSIFAFSLLLFFKNYNSYLEATNLLTTRQFIFEFL